MVTGKQINEQIVKNRSNDIKLKSITRDEYELLKSRVSALGMNVVDSEDGILTQGSSDMLIYSKGRLTDLSELLKGVNKNSIDMSELKLRYVKSVKDMFKECHIKNLRVNNKERFKLNVKVKEAQESIFTQSEIGTITVDSTEGLDLENAKSIDKLVIL